MMSPARASLCEHGPFRLLALFRIFRGSYAGHRWGHLNSTSTVPHENILVPPAGVEPTTSWSEARRSIQLSYGGMREEVYSFFGERAGAF